MSDLLGGAVSTQISYGEVSGKDDSVEVKASLSLVDDNMMELISHAVSVEISDMEGSGLAFSISNNASLSFYDVNVPESVRSHFKRMSVKLSNSAPKLLSNGYLSACRGIETGTFDITEEAQNLIKLIGHISDDESAAKFKAEDALTFMAFKHAAILYCTRYHPEEYQLVGKTGDAYSEIMQLKY